jgi:hypothetical protein
MHTGIVTLKHACVGVKGTRVTTITTTALRLPPATHKA